MHQSRQASRSFPSVGGDFNVMLSPRQEASLLSKEYADYSEEDLRSLLKQRVCRQIFGVATNNSKTYMQSSRNKKYEEHIDMGNWIQYLGLSQPNRYIGGYMNHFARQLGNDISMDLINPLLENKDADLLSGMSALLFQPFISLSFGLGLMQREQQPVVLHTALASLAAHKVSLSNSSDRLKGPLARYFLDDGSAMQKQRYASLNLSPATTSALGEQSVQKVPDGFVESFLRDLFGMLTAQTKNAAPIMRNSDLNISDKMQRLSIIDGGLMAKIHALMQRYWDFGDKNFVTRVLDQLAKYALNMISSQGSKCILSHHMLIVTFAARQLQNVIDDPCQLRLAVYLWESFALIAIMIGLEGIICNPREQLADPYFENWTWQQILGATLEKGNDGDQLLIMAAYNEAKHYKRDDDLYRLAAERKLKPKAI